LYDRTPLGCIAEFSPEAMEGARARHTSPKGPVGSLVNRTI